MKARTSLILGLALSLALGTTSFAHVGELQFIPQVHNPATMVIDGNDDDWAWMDPAFAFTSDLMEKGGEEADFTREDFDAAYFLGWTPPPDNVSTCSRGLRTMCSISMRTIQTGGGPTIPTISPSTPIIREEALLAPRSNTSRTDSGGRSA